MHEIINADLLEWLKEYNGPRFHGVMSDPPYALISVAKRFGKKGSAPAQEGSDGRFTRLSAGFMGQKWDSFVDLDHFEDWVVEWSNSMMRVLYPGAVCMFFGGTRTYHRLARGLERGGFEIIDCLMWLYGAGFPKSHDISKGMDKAAGAEREKVDGGKGPAYQRSAGNVRPWMFEEDHKIDGPVAVTDDAITWDGYGTALKPAWEPIVLCRAPRGDTTFAELAKTYGTGGLNIDGSRLGAIGGGTHCDNRDEYGKCLGHDNAERSTKGETIHGPEYIAGRWPANLLLSHHEDCVKIGEFEVEGRTINRWKEGMKPFGDAAGEQFESEKLPPEMIERWACVGECAVRQLDDQVGTLTSGKMKAGQQRIKSKGFGGYQGGFADTATLRDISGDTGGPSRFFYSGKASRSEKDKGCEHLYWARKDGEMILISEEDWQSLPKKERAKGNIHPSVKPLDCIRYLEKLFKPPDIVKSRLLVPFSGSGSEVIAAMQVGWNEVVGIEIDEKYCMIAEARIAGTLGMF